MQKQKLKKFAQYVQSLLPHETAYLRSKLNSKDQDRVQIMNLVHHNTDHSAQEPNWDTSIDKRKYSKLLSWMQIELNRIDVDRRLDWISTMHQKVLLDRVSPDLDTQIVKSINRYRPHSYYFMKYYEMLVEYRHYLLIRMRYNGHQVVNDYLEKYHFDYQHSRLVHSQMHQATSDIIGTSNEIQKEAIHWKRWLHENFLNSNLDGLNRYMAAIRYIFICLRYNILDDLGLILNQLDSFFQQGQNYSKRLLTNYYDNMLVYYDKREEYGQARYYGFLSIKHNHPDAIIYRNNLVNVLIKSEAFDEALEVIEDANFKLNSTRNFHSVVGFVSNQIRCLTKVGRIKEAVNKGMVFLKAYDKIILKYRWHRFFAAYHGALLVEARNNEILKLTDKYKLAEKENNYVHNKRNAQRILNIYYLIAQLKESKIKVETFKNRMSDLLPPDNINLYDKELIQYINTIR